jgi:hypothetical protein
MNKNQKFCVTGIFFLLSVLGILLFLLQGTTSLKAVPVPEVQQVPQQVADSLVETAPVFERKNTLDLTQLPLGDGKVSNEPRVGYVFACQTNFRSGGADHSGDWVHGETWDVTQKLQVRGEVYWNEAEFSQTIKSTTRLIVGNGLPVLFPTGNFPIARNDPAYQVDRNPNAIAAQEIFYELPLEPLLAQQPTCVPMGAVGVAVNGVALYNALDDAGDDAVANEVQDLCNGHPQQKGQYHYHGPTDCIEGAGEPDTLVGYALDGFGIYSKYGTDGYTYTNEDLDACHGTTSPVMWNGELQDIYHYVITDEYPYIVGCFAGEVQVRR